jgi:asparagine N-glycosylation enzyme membrane subunit Stt3
LIIFISLFWELISGIILSIGGIGGIIWYSHANLNGWYILIAFIVPIITGVLLVIAMYIEKKESH